MKKSSEKDFLNWNELPVYTSMPSQKVSKISCI
jgi:hypothetical protein